jgi:prepilin-type N-terminal cleavage/methylation domain-containing protein
MKRITNNKYQISKRSLTLIRTRLRRNLVNVQAFTLISKACKGFTLIEMLVVISIIGILATIVIANMAGVRERARDAQRKSDISQIQKAMEMYKNAQSPVAYPANLGLLATAYMQTVPQDPSCPAGTCSTGRYIYTYVRNASDSLQYTFWTCLENKSDGQRDSVRGITSVPACYSGCEASGTIANATGACFSVTQP